jgi:DNA-binding transcriptional MerR regulator
MAKKKDYKKLSDTEIVALVDDNVGRSVGYHDSELSSERANVMDYYSGTLPKPTHDGNSKYVSLDVYDAVQSMSAALLETFSAGNKTVQFAPQGADDTKMAAVCTSYTDYVAFRQNDLYSVNSAVIHDGLTSRAGIAKVFWQDQSETTTEYFEDLTSDQLDMVLAQEGVDLGEHEEDELGLFTGEILKTRDTSQVVIENIAPEEFLIEPQAKSLDTVLFCAHRTKKTISDLRLDGYPEKLLKKIGSHSDVDLETDPELLARHSSTSGGTNNNSHGYQDQIRSVMVHEAYIELDVEGSGVAELYKIIKAGNVLLDKEKVNRKPFITFVPLPIPHAFYGNNFAQKIIATQNARTVLTRSILDHAVVTTNPRYMVLKGGLTNPKELIDNRVGGIVNVTRPDSVSPMMQSPLNPFIFQTISMLNDNREETTGVSSLSQGLNKDAISQQNSAALVEQLATMSQQRQKIIARNFANQFLKPLYQAIYQLVIENETQEKIVEIGGEYIEINPSDWADKRDVTVQLHLGYGEQDAEAQKYMSMHQTFQSDPSLQKMYTPQNQYQLISQVMEMSGIKNVADYLTSPDQLPPEQPDPAQELQLEMMKKQLEVQERQTVVAEMKAQMQAQNAQLKLELDKLKAENNFAIQSDNVDLKESQLNHKKVIDTAELVLAQQADEITAIASPNG